MDMEAQSHASKVPDQASDRIIFFILCSLSIIAELFIVISYLSIRRRTTVFYTQVMWLFGADLICFFSYYYSLMPESSKDTGCKIFGFINEISHVSSITWTSIIAGTIFYSMKNKQRTATLPMKYVIGANVITLFFSIYPWITGEYGIYDGFGFKLCWVKPKEFSTLVIAYWVPLILSLVFNLGCYIVIIAFLRKYYPGSMLGDFGILFAFPVVQIISNSGSLLYSLSYIENVEPSASVQLFHAVTRSVEGLLYVIAYGSNYSVRKDIKRAWCKKRKQSNELVGISLRTKNGTSLFENLTYPTPPNNVNGNMSE